MARDARTAPAGLFRAAFEACAKVFSLPSLLVAVILLLQEPLKMQAKRLSAL